MKTIFFENVNYTREMNAKVFVSSLEYALPHWHFEYEILLILQGDILSTTNQKEITLHPGDICFFNPREVHSFRGLSYNAYLCIQFNQQYFKSVLKPTDHFIFEFENYPFLSKNSEFYKYLLNIICNIGIFSIVNNDTSKMKVKALITFLSAKLLENINYKTQDNLTYQNEFADANKLIPKLTQFIDENLTSPTLQQDIFNHMAMSKTTLYRYLKTFLGITLKELIDSMKINRACKLLQADKSIIYITTVCGFSNDSSFYRTFKKKIGFTPKEYKKGVDSTKFKKNIQGYIDFSQVESLVLMKNFTSDDFRLV